jgi:RNA polymerase sigma-70 factor (ECF subfamily)
MKGAIDRAAEIERLHLKYAGVLFDLCVRILKDRAAAEDAVQETFVNAFHALDRFNRGDTHLPWLMRIATNTCLKAIRTNRRRALFAEIYVHACHSTASPGDNAELQLGARQIIEELDRSIDPRSREILLHHYVAGMDQTQISRTMGISRRAVVKRLSQLRQLFARFQPEVSND